MKRKPLRLRKFVCMVGALFLVADLSFAATIEKSSKAAFVPNEISSIEQKFRSVGVMGKVTGTLISSQDADRALLSAEIAAPFLECASSFLRPVFLPAESYVRDNLIFSRGVVLSYPNKPDKEADVAYLSYRVEGRDFLVSQTFDGFQSVIGISMSLKPGEEYGSDQKDKIRKVTETMLDTYLLPDAEAPFEVVIERSKHLDASLVAAREAEGKASNYRQTLKGTYSATGISLVFSKLRFYPGENPSRIRLKDMVPAWCPPADKCFDWVLGRYQPPQSKLGKATQ